MTLNPKQIAKNTSYYTLATIFQKLAAFIYFAFIGRMIGPVNLGDYIYAISFTTIFAILIDIGLEKVLVRESAKDTKNSQTYFSHILGIKIPLLFLTFLAIFSITHLQNYTPLTKQLIYLSAIVMSLDSFTLTINCVFRGFQNLKYESIATILGQVVIVTIGVTGLLKGMSLHILIFALIAGSLCKFIYSLSILIKKYHILPKISYEKKTSLTLLKATIPFALAGIFLRVYSYIDVVLLYNLTGQKEVGFYSVAYKATNAFQFIPLAFVAALFPALSFYYVSSKELLKKTFERALFYLIIVGIPISLGIISTAPEIITKFFGKTYIPSILPLQILMANLILLFLNFPAGTLLNACDREKTNTTILGITMLINIALNLLLIPVWGFIGASIAAVLSTLFLLALRMFYSYKIVKFDIQTMFNHLLKTSIAGTIMFLSVIYIKNYINFYATVLIGGLIYIISLYIAGGVGKKDVKMLYEAIRHKA